MIVFVVIMLLYVCLLLVGYDGHFESESLLVSGGAVRNGTVTGGMFKTTSANVSERISDRFGKSFHLLI